MADWENDTTLVNTPIMRVSKLEPGRYRMRNGHTAELQKQINIPYKDYAENDRVYRIWVGRCVECNAHMTWTLDGSYAAQGSHRNDILERLVLEPTAQGDEVGEP